MAEGVDENPYEMAETGWREFLEASKKIQRAANLLKKSATPIDGYNIEKALIKHKPNLIEQHLEGLRAHRKDKNV
jgi:hypothetical protein